MTNVAYISAAVVLLALVSAVTLLTWHGSITGGEAISFFVGLSFAGIVGGAQHASARLALRGRDMRLPRSQD